MKRSNKPLYYLLVLILTTSMAGGCAGAVAPTGPEATQPPADVSQGDAPQTEAPVTDDLPLYPAEFDGTLTKGNVGGVDVYIGNGRIANELGQILDISVAGTSEASVLQYFEMARFNFQIVESFDEPPNEEGYEPEPNLSVAEVLKTEGDDNLSIAFKLSMETAEKFPVGSVQLIIDPTVAQNRYNHYVAVDPITDSASVTITASQGKVRGRLYRACALVAIGDAFPGSPKSLSGRGAGSFDLTVYGVNAGNNIYRVTGRWNYDYNQDLPDFVSGAVC